MEQHDYNVGGKEICALSLDRIFGKRHNWTTDMHVYNRKEQALLQTIATLILGNLSL